MSTQVKWTDLTDEKSFGEKPSLFTKQFFSGELKGATRRFVSLRGSTWCVATPTQPWTSAHPYKTKEEALAAAERDMQVEASVTMLEEEQR